MKLNRSEVQVSELNYHNRHDVGRVAEVFQEAFKQPPWSIAWAADGLWLEQIRHWRKLRNRFNGTILVARVRGEIVGAAVGHLMDTSEHVTTLTDKLGKGKHYFLRNLAVLPAFQRAGIGTVLTAARIRHARRLRCTSIFGETDENNSAKRKQFERDGFQHVHTANDISFDTNRKMMYYQKRLLTPR